MRPPPVSAAIECVGKGAYFIFLSRIRVKICARSQRTRQQQGAVHGRQFGVTGTDFAQAMSDLVLRDDHPAAMLVATEQGRTAFVNIKKSVRYLVSTNLSELAAMTSPWPPGCPTRSTR